MQSIVDELLRMNKRYSERFVLERAAREEYRKSHAVEIGWLGCMDGRMSGPLVCGMPIGVSQTWQNGGCTFDLEWQSFQNSLWDWFECVNRQGRICLVLVAGHFSKSKKHFGCKAHEYDQNAMQTAVWSQVGQLRDDFEECGGPPRLYAVGCSLETDQEALVFRKQRGSEVFDISQMLDMEKKEVRKRLWKFYSDEIKNENVLECILEVVLGNIAHARIVASMNRPSEKMDHCESVIAFGRGFEWLFETDINRALVLGHFDPCVESKIKTAAEIVLANISERKTISRKHGAALVVSVPFRISKGDPHRKLAERKARYFSAMAIRIITDEVPALLPHLHLVVGVIDNDTRRLSLIRRS